MEKLSAWKIFKITLALSTGLGIGKRIVAATDAALLNHLMNKYPDLYERVMNDSTKNA